MTRRQELNTRIHQRLRHQIRKRLFSPTPRKMMTLTNLANQNEKLSARGLSAKMSDQVSQPRLVQGDVIRNIHYIESYNERDGVLNLTRIRYPLGIVLSQDCDLSLEFELRNSEKSNQDKWLVSVLVAPLYNLEHLLTGDHLSELGLKMQQSHSSTEGRLLRQNRLPRYHYLEFEKEVPIVPSVIDFKHFFSVAVEYLQATKAQHYVCTVSHLYREEISRRFAAYLARIGLPFQLTQSMAS